MFMQQQTRRRGRLRQREDFIQPCIKCKSDLYSNLLVRCSSCQVTKHTYCFEPALIGVPKNKQWSCSNCPDTEWVQRVMTKTTSEKSTIQTWSPPKLHVRKKFHQQPSKSAQPTQQEEDNKPLEEFNWKSFCDKKLDKIQDGKADELVYYQRKRTSCVKKSLDNWRKYVTSKKEAQYRVERYRQAVQHSLPLKRKIFTSGAPVVELSVENDPVAETEAAMLIQLSYLSKHNPKSQSPVLQYRSIEFESEVDEPKMTLAVKEPSNNIVIEALQTEKHNEEKAARSAVHFLVQNLSHEAQTLGQKHFIRKIQRCYRNYQSRRDKKDAAATVLNNSFRSFVSRRKKEKETAAIQLQSMLRGRKSRETSNKLKLEKQKTRVCPILLRFFKGPFTYHMALKNKAALRVQCRWRIKRAKKTFSARRTDKQIQDERQAATALQCMFRKKQAKKYVADLRQRKAAGLLQRYARGWLARKRVSVEKKRRRIVKAVSELGMIQVNPESSTGDVLSALAMYYYSYAEFSTAMHLFERAILNRKQLDGSEFVALAYCHHSTWYSSYEKYNLVRAQQHQADALKTIAVRKDPFALYDIAVTKMQAGDYVTSLETMTHIIQAFPSFQEMSKVFFLSGVQVICLGNFEQGLEYLVHLSDNPPFDYTRIDMMLLISFVYLKTKQKQVAKEGYRAAFTRYRAETPAENRTCWSENDLLFELVQRANTIGHYCLAATICIHLIRRLKVADASSWLQLADAFRHMGRYEQAKQAADSALKIDPTNTYALGIEWDKEAKSFEKQLASQTDFEFLTQIQIGDKDLKL